ncbi:amine oxidoreductase [Sesbania bispinosa]|nr:amine oxidoreductase [Sesbania bispinosa]
MLEKRPEKHVGRPPEMIFGGVIKDNADAIMHEKVDIQVGAGETNVSNTC